MDRKHTRTLTWLVLLALCTALLAGCGASAQDGLLGSWIAKKVTMGTLSDPADEVFKDSFRMVFGDDGECTMSIGDSRSVFQWERTESGAVLVGDEGTFFVTFTDKSGKHFTIDLNGIEVLMEKSRE